MSGFWFFGLVSMFVGFGGFVWSVSVCVASEAVVKAGAFLARSVGRML